MKIYLSGKISGLPFDEFMENFEKEEISWSFGFNKVINPTKIKPLFGIKYWFFHMVADIWYQRTCTHTAFQKNWTDSFGSVIEYIFAKWIFKQQIIFL